MARALAIMFAYAPALCMCAAFVYFAIHRDDANFLIGLFLGAMLLPDGEIKP